MHPLLSICDLNMLPLQSLKAEFEGKHFEWKIEQTLQRPRVVSARIAPFLTKENLFAQVVVRLHTMQVAIVNLHCINLTADTVCGWPLQGCAVWHMARQQSITRLPLFYSSPSLLQVMAVYSTAGVLLRGHGSQAKKVIDYVVFERHLVKAESRWRIAGKLPPQQPWRNVGSSEQSALQSASVS